MNSIFAAELAELDVLLQRMIAALEKMQSAVDYLKESIQDASKA